MGRIDVSGGFAKSKGKQCDGEEGLEGVFDGGIFHGSFIWLVPTFRYFVLLNTSAF